VLIADVRCGSFFPRLKQRIILAQCRASVETSAYAQVHSASIQSRVCEAASVVQHKWVASSAVLAL